MPLPKPKREEKKQKFVARCIDEVSRKDQEEFPNRKQGGSLCDAQWEINKKENDDTTRS